MIFPILFLFLANMAVADCCGTTSNADKNKWQNSGKELVVINGKIFELNVKKLSHLMRMNLSLLILSLTKTTQFSLIP